jgi:hypothetical protein
VRGRRVEGIGVDSSVVILYRETGIRIMGSERWEVEGGGGGKTFFSGWEHLQSGTDAQVLLLGLYLGGNSDAADSVERETDIESNWESWELLDWGALGTGSPAGDLQPSDSHLAGILDDIWGKCSSYENRVGYCK